MIIVVDSVMVEGFEFCNVGCSYIKDLVVIWVKRYDYFII